MHTELLKKENLEEAFSFYGITDPAFCARMAGSAERILSSPAESEIFEKLSAASTDNEFLPWKELEGFKPFIEGEGEIPDLTHLVMISHFDTHRKALEKYHYCDDPAQVDYHKSKIRSLTANSVEKGRMNMDFNLFVWGMEYVIGVLFRHGILIFQYLPNGFVGVHIPDGVDFSSDSVMNTLKGSVPVIRHCFGMDSWHFRCTSWLLSPELQELLKPDSNIRKFCELFDVKVTKSSSIPAFFTKVFRIPRTNDYAKLPEDTSLQRSIKKCLMAGMEFHNGMGITKEKTEEEIFR